MTSKFKPYRANVGIALFHHDGRVLIARRIKDDGPEVIYPGCEWQMPQGGIDPAEDPEAAAKRELWEETGVRSVKILGRLDDWLTYEFPDYSGSSHRLAAFRGQRQLWFAMRFVGDEAEIDLNHRFADGEPEFDAWRWEALVRVPDLVVPFKQAIYRRVASDFRHFSGPSRNG